MSFKSTKWSLIQSLDGSDSESRRALEQLCETYWPAVFALVRRRGFSEADSEDFTQGFFAYAIEKNVFAKADARRGRFRNFLKAAVNNFLSNQWDRMTTQKRGGGIPHISLDKVEWIAQSQPLEEPEAEFDRVWALTLIGQTIGRLQAEYENRGRGPIFAALKPTLTGEGLERSYRAIGRDLSMSETAVKLSVHRMRARFQELLREEISETVSTPEQAQEELADLKSIFFGNT